MSLDRLVSPQEASAWCAAQRDSLGPSGTIGLIPTMGALHEGHMSLVQRAVQENDRVCVSVFVNPLQFGEARDLDDYPRDFEGDCDLLEQAGAHMAFTGTLGQFFESRLVGGELPKDQLADPGSGAAGLEGDFRIGHFEGVATIVQRLFELVRPSRAYFGAKDFQQTLVVKTVSRAMDGPEIVVCSTSREESGMARSSRNTLLTPAGKRDGMFLSRALFAAKALWSQGVREAAALEEHMAAVLALGDLQVEYAAVRDPENWSAHRPEGALDRAVALVAARAGVVRLIDNLVLHETDEPPLNGSRPVDGPDSMPFGAGL